MIVPRLPDAAIADIKVHQASRKLAVQRIVEPVELARCKNCMDDSVVYVSFLGTGPTKQPTTMGKPSTWLEHGWYLIERTASYPCPSCSYGRAQ